MATKRGKKVIKKEKEKQPLFSVGELIFAKVKGYSYWPARITSINDTRSQYGVEFYAENTT